MSLGTHRRKTTLENGPSSTASTTRPWLSTRSWVGSSTHCQLPDKADNANADGSLRTHQAAFNSTVKAVRWLGTQGLRFVLQFWFSKSPMFWLPANWVPYYVEWILSFPRAPLGSISIQVWTAACAAIIALASEACAAVWVLATKKPTPTAKQEKEPMAFSAGQQSGAGAGEKKEL